VGYNIVEYPPYLWNGKLDKRIINIDFVKSVPDRYFNPTVKSLEMSPLQSGNLLQAFRINGNFLYLRKPDISLRKE